MPSNFKAVEARKDHHHSMVSCRRERGRQFRLQVPPQAQLVLQRRHIFLKEKILNLTNRKSFMPPFPAYGIVPKLNYHCSKEKNKTRKTQTPSFNSWLSSSGFNFQPLDFAVLFSSRLEYSVIKIFFPCNHTTITPQLITFSFSFW